MNDEKKNRKPTFWQIVLSTLGAAFGVQSSKTRERDFQQGSIFTYIIAGVIFVALFIGVVTAIVNAVLSESGV